MPPELQQLTTFITDLKAKANAALAGLPPLEQFEASAELAYCFRSLTRQANELMQFADLMNQQMTEAAAKIATRVTAEAQTALKASGEYLAKVDHDAAVTAAANAREAEVRQAIQEAAASASLLQSRRKQLVDTKVMPAAAAERLPDTVLTGDDFIANANKVVARLEKLKPFGITAESAPDVVGEVASIPLDAEGDVVLSQRLKLVESAATAQRRTAPVANPLALPNAQTPAAATSDAQLRRLI